MDESFRDSQNFSLTSIINNFSKLLDGNSDESFLVRVNSAPSSTVLPPATDEEFPFPYIDEKTQLEVLRRLSKIDYRCSQNVFPQSISHSAMNGEEEEHAEVGDSWDEFDKIMEKSLPAKEWELLEFEEFAQKNDSRLLDGVSGFISAEDAKIQMDKEEQERAQFCKSSSDNFFPGRATPSILLDPLQVTNYFQSRSSFPIDRCANDSTMFMDQDPNWATYIEDKTLRACPIETVLTSSAGPSSQPVVSKKTRGSATETSASDDKANAITEYLTSSKSDGASTESIIDYVMRTCGNGLIKSTPTDIAVPKTTRSAIAPKSKCCTNSVAPKSNSSAAAPLSKQSTNSAFVVPESTNSNKKTETIHNNRKSAEILRAKADLSPPQKLVAFNLSSKKPPVDRSSSHTIHGQPRNHSTPIPTVVTSIPVPSSGAPTAFPRGTPIVVIECAAGNSSNQEPKHIERKNVEPRKPKIATSPPQKLITSNIPIEAKQKLKTVENKTPQQCHPQNHSTPFPSGMGRTVPTFASQSYGTMSHPGEYPHPHGQHHQFPPPPGYSCPVSIHIHLPSYPAPYPYHNSANPDSQYYGSQPRSASASEIPTPHTITSTFDPPRSYPRQY